MLSVSPDRNKFRIECELKSAEEGHKTPEQAEQMIDFYMEHDRLRKEREVTEEWQQNNLEYDLRSTDWILEKVRNSTVYGQHLYAAMCNREFRKIDVVEILKESKWSCSWRYAAGIVADMRESGDYMDWYCSGIKGNDNDIDDDQFQAWTTEQREYYILSKEFVSESVVAPEIMEDLNRLGWMVLDFSDDDNF